MNSLVEFKKLHEWQISEEALFVVNEAFLMELEEHNESGDPSPQSLKQLLQEFGSRVNELRTIKELLKSFLLSSKRKHEKHQVTLEAKQDQVVPFKVSVENS